LINRSSGGGVGFPPNLVESRIIVADTGLITTNVKGRRYMAVFCVIVGDYVFGSVTFSRLYGRRGLSVTVLVEFLDSGSTEF